MKWRVKLAVVLFIVYAAALVAIVVTNALKAVR